MIGSPEPSAIKTLMRVETHFPQVIDLKRIIFYSKSQDFLYQIFFPKSSLSRSDRESGVLIQAASIFITNTSVGQSKTVTDALPTLLQSNLYANPTYFPNMATDFSLPKLVQHFHSFSDVRSCTGSLENIIFRKKVFFTF